MILYIVLVDYGEKSGRPTNETNETKEREITMEDKKNPVNKALDIAKHIIELCTCRKNPIPVSNIKLQKLLYLVYGYFLLDLGEKLFAEPFEAWQYGPVAASVYDYFCNFAGSYISLIDTPPELPKSISDAIDPIIEENMEREVFDLVEETHQEGSAWRKAMKRRDSTSVAPVLKDEDIIEEFRKRRDSDGGTSDS